ncbi:MAG: VanZ family protein [Christensenella sp.]|nr:VanZ family protein [Christensenella sp.]
MSTLFYAATIALQTAPYIGLVTIIPYVMMQYKRSKYISVKRCTYIYIFVFYCMAAYFLTMLPFPSIESVASMKSGYVQLMPFAGIVDFIENSGISQPDTMFSAFTGGILWGMLFNIALLIPLGFFLRFLFSTSLKKTILIGFLVSLFFELTQLSGLFFIYPRPYRIFDVDDMILNTFGAILGWLIVPMLKKVLPSPDIATSNRLELGCEVSLGRRIFAAVIDNAVIILLIFPIVLAVPTFVKIIDSHNIISIICLLVGIYIVLMILYRGVIMWLAKGKSLGYAMTNLTLYSQGKRPPNLGQCVVRALLSYTGILLMPVYILILMLVASDSNGILRGILVALGAVGTIVYAWFFLTLLLNGITHGKMLFYDSVTHTYLNFRHNAKVARHTSMIAKGVLSLSQIDSISEVIYETLVKNSFSGKAAIKARLLSEGVLLEWVNGGLDDAVYELLLDNRSFRKALVLSAVGDEVKRSQTEDDYYHVLGGLRLAFETHYSGNRNICTIELQ